MFYGRHGGFFKNAASYSAGDELSPCSFRGIDGELVDVGDGDCRTDRLAVDCDVDGLDIEVWRDDFRDFDRRDGRREFVGAKGGDDTVGDQQCVAGRLFNGFDFVGAAADECEDIQCAASGLRVYSLGGSGDVPSDRFAIG